MNLKTLIQDDEAVSPVIGVILMVAITVILAAVIATFVLGLGDSLSNNAPQASFECTGDLSGNTGDVTMTGGDSIPADEITIQNQGSKNTSPSTFTAGDTLTNGDAGTSTTVVWQSGDSSAVLKECSA